jgi:hypothetical protein
MSSSMADTQGTVLDDEEWLWASATAWTAMPRYCTVERQVHVRPGTRPDLV